MKKTFAAILASATLLAGCAPQKAYYYTGYNDDNDPVLIKAAAPHYPRNEILAGIEGWVVVSYTVTVNGTVEDIKVLEEHPANTFAKSAIRAVKKYKYKPAFKDGVPVEKNDHRGLIQFKLPDTDREYNELNCSTISPVTGKADMNTCKRI